MFKYKPYNSMTIDEILEEIYKYPLSMADTIDYMDKISIIKYRNDCEFLIEILCNIIEVE